MKAVFIAIPFLFIGAIVNAQSTSEEAADHPSKHRFVYATSLGVQYGEINQREQFFSTFHLEAGYEYASRYSITLGTGLEESNVILAPAMATLRVNLLRRESSPFIYAQGGYGFPLKRKQDPFEYEGGRFGGFGVGMKKSFNSKAAIAWSVGYRQQRSFHIIKSQWQPDYRTEYTNIFNRLVFQMSFFF